MVYNAQNELGYQFKTTREDREVVDFDGIPLMLHLKTVTAPVKHGFSNAAKFHKARMMSRKVTVTKQTSGKLKSTIVALDLETTGLMAGRDVIMSIGAVKRTIVGDESTFYRLIQINQPIPPKVAALTGLTTAELNSGVSLKMALADLRKFVGSAVIVGYNLRFDERFLTAAFQELGVARFTNRFEDVLPVVKDTNEFLDNYRLETVLSEYRIKNTRTHHALSDAQATLNLAIELVKNGDLLI